MSLSSSWYQQVRTRLESSGIFVRIEVIGAKVRAFIREELYVDIYYDPTTSSYSYALIDQTLPDPGDKRVFGWDDYPHESVPEIKRMKSYPHHFQKRSQGRWIFEESSMRGDVKREMYFVIKAVKDHLCEETR